MRLDWFLNDCSGLGRKWPFLIFLNFISSYVMKHMSGYNVSLPWASCGNLWNNNLTCVDVGSTKAGQADLIHFKDLPKYICLVPLKSNKCFLNECRWISQFWAVFLSRTSRIKFLLASIKSLTSCENPPVPLLQEACSGFPRTACDSKSCFGSRL
jgi:hypothetical protein